MTTALRSSEALLQRMRDVAQLTPTAAALERQRVSFILSEMKEDSGITKESIEKALKKHREGSP